MVAVEHPLVSGGGECPAEAGLPGQGWPTVSRGEAWRGPGGGQPAGCCPLLHTLTQAGEYQASSQEGGLTVARSNPRFVIIVILVRVLYETVRRSIFFKIEKFDLKKTVADS